MSETKRSQQPPSKDDTDVAVWRRVAASGVLVARCCAVARRGINLKRNGRSAAQPALRVATDVAHAGARRRFSAPPASPVRHQQPIATNKRSTSAAARRPPTPAQSAAQARRAARAPRRSIRMPIALHGLALGKASDAISPLNAVVEPGCCRTPPAAAASSAFAATARAPAFAATAGAPAFAPNRISLKRNRRRRPAGGASGSL